MAETLTKPMVLDDTFKTYMDKLILAVGGTPSAGTDALVIASLLSSNEPYTAWRLYANARLADGLSLNDIADRWFSNLDDGKTYTTQILRTDMSGGADTLSSTTGKNSLKLDDNADLACLPSTATTEAVDDYAAIPGFMHLDCNYKIDADTLEPILVAVEDVGDGVDYKPTDGSLVGVISATYWRKEIQDDDYRQLSIAFGNRGVGYEPLFASIKAEDNTARAYYIFAKWMLGYNDDQSLLYNGYGAQPASYKGGSDASVYNYTICHNNVNTYMSSNYGSQYGGFEYGMYIIWAVDMMMIKYGVLGNNAVMVGCASYSYTALAAAAEEGVKRIVVTATNAANFIIGSRVSLGTTTDRNTADCYNICDICTITKKETLSDDDDNVAIYLDSDSTFNVTAETYIIAQPYANGYTEQVIGHHDGTPISNTSGKEPFRLQGVEFGLGIYDTAGDTKIYYDAGIAHYYTVAKCANRTTTDSISSLGNYTEVATFDNSDASAAAWQAVSEIDRNNVSGVMSASGCTTSQRFRCSQYHYGTDASSYWRELRAFGYLNTSSHAGVLCVYGLNGLGYGNWYIGSRPCGTGSNRGE